MTVTPNAPPITPFVKWLNEQLRARRMSQRQLADRCGIDHSTISRLTREGRSPKLETVMAIAAALDVKVPSNVVNGYLSIVADAEMNPITRVERALRRDVHISDDDAQRVMDYYMRLRTFHSVDMEAAV